MTTQTCKDRIQGEWANTREDLNRSTDEELSDTKHGKFLSYERCILYRINSTRKNNASIGYWRYQMSWGGPSDEFRIYLDEDNKIYKIEYWYLDWFDGASIIVKDSLIYHIIEEYFLVK